MGDTAKYSVLYVSLHGVESFFYCFLSIFLLSRGFNGGEVGTLMSLSPFLLALSLPLWGKIDSGKTRKILLIVCTIILAASELAILYANAFAVVAAAVVVFSIARAPRVPSVDSMTTLFCIENGKEFSFFRAWGSIGYTAAVFAGGFLYQYSGFAALTFISCAFVLVFVTDMFLTKPLKIDIAAPKPDLKLLFKNKQFLILIAFQIIFYSAYLFNANFEVVYIEKRGLSTSLFSWLTLIRVGMEIITFVVLRKKKLPFKLLFSGAAGLIIFQSAFFFFMDLPIFTLFIGDFLAGIGSGFIVYVNNKYLSASVRPKNLTVAMYIMIMLQNLAVGTIFLIGGFVMDAVGIKYMYVATGSLLILSLVYSIFLFKNNPTFIEKDVEN